MRATARRSAGEGTEHPSHDSPPESRDGAVTTLMKIYFFPDGGLCKLIFIYLAKPFA